MQGDIKRPVLVLGLFVYSHVPHHPVGIDGIPLIFRIRQYHRGVVNVSHIRQGETAEPLLNVYFLHPVITPLLIVHNFPGVPGSPLDRRISDTYASSTVYMQAVHSFCSWFRLTYILVVSFPYNHQESAVYNFIFIPDSHVLAFLIVNVQITFFQRFPAVFVVLHQWSLFRRQPFRVFTFISISVRNVLVNQPISEQS